jgi:hypothetical protein
VARCLIVLLIHAVTRMFSIVDMKIRLHIVRSAFRTTPLLGASPTQCGLNRIEQKYSSHAIRNSYRYLNSLRSPTDTESRARDTRSTSPHSELHITKSQFWSFSSLQNWLRFASVVGKTSNRDLWTNNRAWQSSLVMQTNCRLRKVLHTIGILYKHCGMLPTASKLRFLR